MSAAPSSKPYVPLSDPSRRPPKLEPSPFVGAAHKTYVPLTPPLKSHLPFSPHPLSTPFALDKDKMPTKPPLDLAAEYPPSTLKADAVTPQIRTTTHSHFNHYGPAPWATEEDLRQDIEQRLEASSKLAATAATAGPAAEETYLVGRDKPLEPFGALRHKPQSTEFLPANEHTPAYFSRSVYPAYVPPAKCGLKL
jgi:hypothetical protein